MRLVFGLVASIVVCCPVSFAESPPTQPAEPLLIEGDVVMDANWSGEIVITGPTRIIGATVTVTAGTKIEFAADKSAPPLILEVGTEAEGGRLVLEGTEQRPITIRSRNREAAGTIIARARGGERIEWRHTRFESLGRATGQAAVGSGAQIYEPAVTFVTMRDKTELRLEGCTFNDCARVFLRTSPQSTGRMSRCDFREGRERIDATLLAFGEGRFEVTDNRFQGVVDVDGLGVVFARNLMIGPRTALSINSPSQPPSTVVGNYIHNTTADDDGRYALKCRDPQTEIRDNILRGGTYVVLEGSRRMSGNVLIGSPALNNPISGTSRTRYLVAHLPGRAVFTENILIGPASALVATHGPPSSSTPPATGEPQSATRRTEGESIRDITIRKNIFEGLGETDAGIRFNVLAREPIGAVIEDNLFLRVPTLVMDEAETPGTVAVIDGNRFGANDRFVETVAKLYLTAPLSGPPDDRSADLLEGRTTVAKIRAHFVGAYGSPR
jgi:hypothetical protein